MINLTMKASAANYVQYSAALASTVLSEEHRTLNCTMNLALNHLIFRHA